MAKNRHRDSRKTGMTLIEVILAVTLAGFVMTAAVAFLVSISDTWTKRNERNFFTDHVDGVCEFLTASFTNAGLEIALSENNQNGSPAPGDEGEPGAAAGDAPGEEVAVNTDNPEEVPQGNTPEGGPPNGGTGSSSGGGLVQRAEDPISWERIPGAGDYEDPLLSFSFNEPPPLLVASEEAPLTSVSLFLHFDQEDGLSLLWYSNLQEDVEALNDLQRTLVSPLVSQVQYVYWDERFEKWETEDSPREDEGNDEASQSFLLPRFLHLTFEHDGEERQRTIPIPVPSQDALIF